MPLAATWRDVPLEKTAAWDEVFQESQEGVSLSAPCPVCGRAMLHRYFMVGRPMLATMEGRRFRATGACWEWCSGCHSYMHSTALVPDWWASTLEVDESALTAEPGALESAVRKALGDSEA
jgi:hypothetical protein